jgi:hypothetical protein
MITSDKSWIPLSSALVPLLPRKDPQTDRLSFTVSNKGVNMVDIAPDVLRYMPLHWAATDAVRIPDISYSLRGSCAVAIGRLEAESR